MASGRFFFDTLEVNKMSDAVQVPYAASSYPCGTATKPRTCTGSTTGNGANTITSAGSWIVSDSVGACTGRVELVARDQGEYLVELDYRDRKVCTVTCFEVIRSGESIEHRPCEGS